MWKQSHPSESLSFLFKAEDSCPMPTILQSFHSIINENVHATEVPLFKPGATQLCHFV